MRTQANSAVCNFFALLKDDTVRKIDLLQAITNNIKSCFIDNSTKLMDSETEEILFDGNFNIDGNEVLYVEFPLSDTLLEANTNSIGLNTLDISTDEIKSLFWIENNIYYFQNFDKRKLLQNKNVLFWNNSTYDKLSNDALIVENTVNAIYKNGKFYFRFSSVRLNRLRNKLLANYLKSGGNELATVRISAFCVAMLSNNSFILQI